MEDQLNQLLEFKTLVQAQLLAILPVVVGLAWKYVRGRLGPERLSSLTTVARVAVFAAEELAHKGGKVDEPVSGKEKLAYATGRVRELASRAGVKVSDDEAKVLIEAVLNEVRPYTQPPEPVNVGGEDFTRDPQRSVWEPDH